jgi:transcriptional regulator with XRE-family HTH domain
MKKATNIDYDGIFAKKLKALLERHPKTNESTTMTKLARLLEIRQQTVSQWVEGSTTPALKHLKDIAAYFEITIDELVTGVSSENESFHIDTGLSGLAIDRVKQNYSKNNIDSKAIGEFFNMILESDYAEYIECMAKEAIDYIIAKAVQQDGSCIPQNVWLSENPKYRVYEVADIFKELIKSIGNDKKNQKRALKFFFDNDCSLLTSNDCQRAVDVVSFLDNIETTESETSALDYDIVEIPGSDSAFIPKDEE